MSGGGETSGGRTFPWHPFLVGLYPIVALYAHNAGVTDPFATVRSVPIVLSGAVIVWLVCWLLVRDRDRAALMCSTLVLAMFSWGSVEWAVRDLLAMQARLFFVVYSLCVLAIIVGIVLAGQRARRSTKTVNRIALVLLALPIAQGLLTGPLYEGLKLLWPSDRDRAVAVATTAPSDQTPDVYFLVLDGYARADVLARLYDYDNRPFLEAMKSKGFFVAERSRANYPQTMLSLASCLNMTHVHELTSLVGTNSKNRTTLMLSIRRNKVFDFLRARGFQIVAFASGYDGTELPRDADVYLTAGWTHNEFETVLLQDTPIPTVLLHIAGSDYLADRHRAGIRFTFDQLGALPARDSKRPMFVFAHVITPHPPFVFGPNGEDVHSNVPFSLLDGTGRYWTAKEYRERYVEQLQYVNKLVEATADRILADSKVPPVIAVVADHGPKSANMKDLEERFGILCMVCAPALKCDMLYDSITPVNLFRTLLSCCFDAGYPLIEDTSYFAPYQTPFQLRPVGFDSP